MYIIIINITLVYHKVIKGWNMWLLKPTCMLAMYWKALILHLIVIPRCF